MRNRLMWEIVFASGLALAIILVCQVAARAQLQGRICVSVEQAIEAVHYGPRTSRRMTEVEVGKLVAWAKKTIDFGGRRPVTVVVFVYNVAGMWVLVGNDGLICDAYRVSDEMSRVLHEVVDGRRT